MGKGYILVQYPSGWPNSSENSTFLLNGGINRLDRKGTKLSILFGGHQVEKRYCLYAFWNDEKENQWAQTWENGKMGTSLTTQAWPELSDRKGEIL